MSIESNKLDNIHTETAVLDKPCKFCKVLELDDALYGGEIKNNGNRGPFVDFDRYKDGTAALVLEER
uniref:WGS project CBME000000000 data, contig CS3487_c001012 n=1 Tax=Fusarium pseudograminearum CS3487 TaxID=1318458 RepID=A0A096PDV0_FUSPS|nr:unnamed protein product [Fusarium pseudograminearum CS3487]